MVRSTCTHVTRSLLAELMMGLLGTTPPPSRAIHRYSRTYLLSAGCTKNIPRLTLVYECGLRELVTAITGCVFASVAQKLCRIKSDYLRHIACVQCQRYVIDTHSSALERQTAGRTAHEPHKAYTGFGNCFTEHLPSHMPFATLHRLSGSFQAPGQRLLYKTRDMTAHHDRVGERCCLMTCADLSSM